MDPANYLPGAGWSLAGQDPDDGTVWADLIIAWHFHGGVGTPLTARQGSPLISDEGEDISAYWLVPPGMDPAKSPYRP